MSTILDEIVANRREEVLAQKQIISVSEMESKTDFSVIRNSLSTNLLLPGSSGIIAEFKRRSPSKGVINDQVQPEIVAKGYADAGAAGVSVLTDRRYFGGSDADFIAARVANPFIPMLRKDFMVDEYQLFETRFLNADVVLLIAAVLGKEEKSLP